LTGLAGSGKTTVAGILVERCRERGVNPLMLDGDVMREALARHGGYESESRLKMGFTYARFAKAFAAQGHLVIVATISLFHALQCWNRENTPRYLEVLLDVPMTELRRRDKNGLYSGAADPELVVGLGQLAEFPQAPDVVVGNHGDLTADRAADLILAQAGALLPIHAHF
jgi:adenylylsulfate kinase-like enzyme